MFEGHYVSLEESLSYLAKIEGAIDSADPKSIQISPAPFPSERAEQQRLLRSIANDTGMLNTVLLELLTVISWYRDVIDDPSRFGSPPAELDMSPLTKLKGVEYIHHYNHDEATEFVASVKQFCQQSREHVEGCEQNRTTFQKICELIDSPDSIPNKSPEQISVIKAFNGIPEEHRPIFVPLVRFAVLRKERLAEARIGLDFLKAFYLGVERVKTRLMTELGIHPPPVPSVTDLCLTDGPVPPDKFNYQDKELIIRRPKVWKLIAELWTSKGWTIAMSDLAIPVWNDHAMEVNETILGSVRRDANKFFEQNDIQLSIKTLNRYCVMEPCSRPARADQNKKSLKKKKI